MEAMKKIMKDIPSFPRKIAKAVMKKTTRGRRNTARDTGGDAHQTQDAQEKMNHHHPGGLQYHPVDVYHFPGDLQHSPGDMQRPGNLLQFSEHLYRYPGELYRYPSDSDIINLIVDL